MRISDWSSDVCSSDLLRVAGDAELVRALDLHSREHLRDELGEHRGQENEVMFAAGDLLRQLDDARQRARRAHERQVAAAAERVLALEHDDEVERLVEDLRERVRRVQAERRQHRHDLLAEVRSEEHTSELQSLMRNSYAVFGLKK